jgi:hypothetical protein
VAFGVDAYNDRIDCFKSDLEGPAAPPAAPKSLDGLAGAAGELPKKSSPSRDSAGFVCFAGAGCPFGGGCVPRGGPVLGLSGGEMSSPKRSMAGFASFFTAAVDCLWDVERSIFDLPEAVLIL